MSRWDGIDEFVATAEAESFSRAARRLGLSTSGVSRAVATLEERLQTRLLYRTTRRVSLTDAGRAFLARARRLIAERDEALASVGEDDGDPRGLLRMTCSTAYGERFVVPAVNRFMLSHPKLALEIDLDDAVRDIVSEGFDLAIRFGRLTDSRLIAKRLASRTRRLCAAPSYLTRAGTPRSIADLAGHVCILGAADTWPFRDGEREIAFKPQGRWRCNSGQAVLDAALLGLGVCQLPNFYVDAAISDGRLVPLLEANRPADEGVWAVYPHLRLLPAKVRLLVEHLEEALSGQG
ncbi:LysR family transcriptional regulator [Caulobacter vibrioides]|uniref:LysR family transcriptional regulator n=1 Tax=Caulobacter vibrioides TaxID=155892 RepID=UPI000BB4B697|nr:LysR family transcriptional regulator [Caulobacter vibrioides]ATC25505.1 LysR family transcriptional regulator [Caulobacter vibrioides]AZH13599.1 LysR family transcriptional regulator [Caulobacter vibrioides]PLR14465.1 LysR family transcriptional regulator [Caulobacter vibrioides]